MDILDQLLGNFLGISLTDSSDDDESNTSTYSRDQSPMSETFSEGEPAKKIFISQSQTGERVCHSKMDEERRGLDRKMRSLDLRLGRGTFFIYYNYILLYVSFKVVFNLDIRNHPKNI